MIRYLILAVALLVTACTSAGCGDATKNEALRPAPSVVDTTASTGKSGAYISLGSFTGGEITDGKDVHDIDWSRQDGFERVEIRIHEARWGDSENAGPVDVPCRFTVRREDFPARLTVVVSGTRMFSASSPELPSEALVTGFYRIVYLDDAGVMFAFDLNNDTEFEVFETHDPAVIVIDVRPVPAGSHAGPETLFSLRSASWAPGERQGHLQENLMRSGAVRSRVLRDAEGTFCVEEGLYPTRQEAEERQKVLAGKNIVLYVEQRGAGDQPRNILPEDK
jgi:hypothetical protein